MTMNPEAKPDSARGVNEGLQNNPNSSVPEHRIGEVRDFGEMKSYLPDDLKESTLNILDEYFKATLLIEEEKKVKAKKKFDGLKKRKPGNYKNFDEFEDKNKELLSRIQMAVLGYSRQNHITPLQQRSVKYK